MKSNTPLDDALAILRKNGFEHATLEWCYERFVIFFSRDENILNCYVSCSPSSRLSNAALTITAPAASIPGILASVILALATSPRGRFLVTSAETVAAELQPLFSLFCKKPVADDSDVVIPISCTDTARFHVLASSDPFNRTVLHVQGDIPGVVAATINFFDEHINHLLVASLLCAITSHAINHQCQTRNTSTR